MNSATNGNKTPAHHSQYVVGAVNNQRMYNNINATTICEVLSIGVNMAFLRVIYSADQTTHVRLCGTKLCIQNAHDFLRAASAFECSFAEYIKSINYKWIPADFSRLFLEETAEKDETEKISPIQQPELKIEPKTMVIQLPNEVKPHVPEILRTIDQWRENGRPFTTEDIYAMFDGILGNKYDNKIGIKLAEDNNNTPMILRDYTPSEKPKSTLSPKIEDTEHSKEERVNEHINAPVDHFFKYTNRSINDIFNNVPKKNVNPRDIVLLELIKALITSRRIFHMAEEAGKSLEEVMDEIGCEYPDFDTMK